MNITYLQQTYFTYLKTLKLFGGFWRRRGIFFTKTIQISLTSVTTVATSILDRPIIWRIWLRDFLVFMAIFPHCRSSQKAWLLRLYKWQENFISTLCIVRTSPMKMFPGSPSMLIYLNVTHWKLFWSHWPGFLLLRKDPTPTQSRTTKESRWNFSGSFLSKLSWSTKTLMPSHYQCLRGELRRPILVMLIIRRLEKFSTTQFILSINKVTSHPRPSFPSALSEEKWIRWGRR